MKTCMNETENKKLINKLINKLNYLAIAAVVTASSLAISVATINIAQAESAVISTAAANTVDIKTAEKKSAVNKKPSINCPKTNCPKTNCPKTNCPKDKNTKKPAKPASTWPSQWKGTQATLGYSQNTGNTIDNTFNSNLTVMFTEAHIKNQLLGDMQYSSSDKGMTKEKYYVDNQLDYMFLDSHKQFLFLDANATFDHFSPYTHVVIGSAGYGLSLIDKPSFTWTAQIGPGVRQLRERENDLSRSYFITNSQTTLNYLLTKDGKSKITEVMVYNFGQPYDYYSSNSSLVLQVYGHLSTVFSYLYEHVSQIPAGSVNKSKTDTTTTANLVFTY